MDDFLNEDSKYGGLEANNAKEGLDYYQIENVFTHVTKEEQDLNSRIESDYHNTYYQGKGKYGLRQIKCSNKEYLKRKNAG